MKLPRRSIPELKSDCERAFLAVTAKRAELIQAIDQRDIAEDIEHLKLELDALIELWSAAMDSLVGAAEERE